MTMNIVEMGAINNIYANITRNMRDDAHRAIAELKFEHLFKKAGTLTTASTVRIDMQGTFNRDGFTWSNIQVQVNGARGNSTIAHVELSHQSEHITNEENQHGAAQMVRRALEQSLDTGRTYVVTGTLP